MPAAMRMLRRAWARQITLTIAHKVRSRQAFPSYGFPFPYAVFFRCVEYCSANTGRCQLWRVRVPHEGSPETSGFWPPEAVPCAVSSASHGQLTRRNARSSEAALCAKPAARQTGSVQTLLTPVWTPRRSRDIIVNWCGAGLRRATCLRRPRT